MANDTAGSTVERAKELHKAGRLDEAAGGYRAVLAADPDNIDAAHYLGVLLVQTGKLADATVLLARAAAARPDWAEARNNYGVALREQGLNVEAIAEFRAAADARPDMFGAHNNLADAFLLIGNLGAAIEAAAAAARLNPDAIEPLLTLATAQMLRGEHEAALDAVHRARTIEPANDRAVAIFRTALSRIVQPWHFPMMNDTPRNDAYEAAIRRAVTPDALVLDIGTGAGLLSMMAARAGAKRVVTCEMSAPMAIKAQQIVASNGFADRIAVHHKRSTALQVGAELPEKADVLVSEIFDSDLLGEGVLASMEDAHARLIKPGAKIIPQAASAMVALAGGDQLAAMVQVGTAAGFDVSALNEYMPERCIIDGGRFKFDFLSEPAAALSFDFRQPRYPRQERIFEVKAIKSGLCLGVVQWLHIQLDATTSFENRPGGDPRIPTGWLHSLFTFAPPVYVTAGQTVRVLAGHARDYPYFRLAEIV